MNMKTQTCLKNFEYEQLIFEKEARNTFTYQRLNWLPQVAPNCPSPLENGEKCQNPFFLLCLRFFGDFWVILDFLVFLRFLSSPPLETRFNTPLVP